MLENVSQKKEASIYNWAFVAGMKLMESFERIYGEKRAERKMEALLLTLRSEMIPDRFRRALIDIIIEVVPVVGIPQEVKVERSWTINEFYRYSTAILAGLFDAFNAWRESKKKEAKEKAKGDINA